MLIRYIDDRSNNVVLISPQQIRVADKENAFYIISSGGTTFDLSIDFSNEGVFNSLCAELYEKAKIDLVPYSGMYTIHKL